MMVDRGDCQENRQSRMTGVHSPIAQDQNGRAVFHRAGSLQQQVVQGPAERPRPPFRPEEQADRPRGPTFHFPSRQGAELVILQHGMGKMQLRRMLRSLRQKI